MKKSFDLYNELMNNGFEVSKNRYGLEVLTKQYEREAGNTLQGTWTKVVWVDVQFNAEHTTCTAYYHEGNHFNAFKAKTHLSDKRAFNAIKQTVENCGFEF